MSYDELLKLIEETHPKEDWKLVHTNWAEEAFLREDPRLRIRMRYDDEGIHRKQFDEEWATRYPDPVANSYWHDLTYDGALIERFILVSVDGARARLPLPDRNSLEVELLAFKIAQIFDRLNQPGGVHGEVQTLGKNERWRTEREKGHLGRQVRSAQLPSSLMVP